MTFRKRISPLLTCENWGFEQLHEFINLNQHIDSHFKLSTVFISIASIKGVGEHTKSEEDDTLAHMPEREGIVKTWPQRCSTRI